MNPVSKCISVHGAGKKSEPSSVRLYQYPNVSTVLANKSFFNADKVEFKWNHSGNNLLLLCNTETSANSYYGDSTLHQIRLDGESQLVQLSIESNFCSSNFIIFIKYRCYFKARKVRFTQLNGIPSKTNLLLYMEVRL
jgi:uncharacterized protein with WD repeat